MDQLDAAFTALADPTRRAIVTRLARGDATVNELAAPFDMTLPAISKHLKVLERCGLISRTRRAQFRPCHLERQACATSREHLPRKKRLPTEHLARQKRPLGEHLPQAGAAPQVAPPSAGAPPAAEKGTNRE